MRLTISTWNINSVRLRIDLVERFLKDTQPDILCLQETKCIDDQFPSAAFRRLGYEHLAISGQKGYHGVAIASRLPFAAVTKRGWCAKEDARYIAVTLDDTMPAASGLALHNFYIPAGGDVPDPAVNDKFAHKLTFLRELHEWGVSEGPASRRAVLVGDLNIAPYVNDVWSHKQLLDVVSHTPIETEGLEKARLAGGWVDAMRTLIPEPTRLYTWWSYRSPDWAAADKGRRLDHVWVSPDLSDALDGIGVLREARGWERPSDHVPVTVSLDLTRAA